MGISKFVGNITVNEPLAPWGLAYKCDVNND
jgi:hypothetical protein